MMCFFTHIKVSQTIKMNIIIIIDLKPELGMMHSEGN
jgi:hypothetical protein